MGKKAPSPTRPALESPFRQEKVAPADSLPVPPREGRRGRRYEGRQGGRNAGERTREGNEGISTERCLGGFRIDEGVCMTYLSCDSNSERLGMCVQPTHTPQSHAPQGL